MINEAHEVAQLQKSCQISNGLDQLLVRVILDETGRIVLEQELDSAADLNKECLGELLRHVGVLLLCAGALARSCRRSFENLDESSEDLKNASLEEDTNEGHKELFQSLKHAAE